MNAPLALLCLLIAVGVAAYIIATWWAYSDHKTIKGRILSGLARDLNHGELLGWRIVVMLFGFGGVWCVLKWTGSTMWYLLPLAGVAWAVFGSQHVWKLNKLRGMDWRYLAPDGNVWDRFWMRTAWRGSFFRDVIKHHPRIYTRALSTEMWYQVRVIWGDEPFDYAVITYGYRGKVHKAGTRAMLFRAVVLLLSVVGYAVILLSK